MFRQTHFGPATDLRRRPQPIFCFEAHPMVDTLVLFRYLT